MKTLAQIQKALNVPKERENKFGGYKFRNKEDIEAAVKKLLDDDDVFYTTYSIFAIGNALFVEALAVFNQHHAKGYAMHALEKKGMDSAQLSGATQAYAGKYALAALFALDDTPDADSTNTHEEKSIKPTRVFTKDEMVSKINAVKTNTELDAVLREIQPSLNNLSKVNKADYDVVVKTGITQRGLVK